jgi:hypothetical protein
MPRGAIPNATLGNVEAGGKNASRIAAARWNCASAAGGIVTAAFGFIAQLWPLVFTYCRSWLAKNESNRPPGENARAKSSIGASAWAPRANG